MAERLPRITGRDLLRALARGGWQRVNQVGSHVHLKHPDRPGRVTVPVHSGETLRLKTLTSILDQAGMTVEELNKLL